MKRPIRLMLLLMSISLTMTAYGQNNYVFGVFRSFPVGAYGSKDLQDEGSFAEPGIGFLLETKASGRSWPEGLTLGIHFSYQNNSLNNGALKLAYDEVLEEELGVPINSQISSGNYHPFVLTAGPYYEIRIGKVLIAGIRTGLGMMFLNADPISLDLLDSQGNSILQEVLSTSGRPTFTYLAGLNLGIKLGEYISLNLFADHSSANEGTKTQFRDIPELESNLKISYINTGISLEFNFQ